jgi:SAM-dependent methyltransferase
MDTKEYVKEAYGKIAKGQGGCGCGCGPGAGDIARAIGYSKEELSAIPAGSNLGLGIGNPIALAGLREGETVLDLGSGAGFDCFVAAKKVGDRGRVIGVDMTPEMVEKARENAEKAGTRNVEFRLGEIENLPVRDDSVDVAISNCVINLSTDKPKVFREVHRVLRPKGRIAFSDVALLEELPTGVRESIEAHAGCVAGAVLVDEYKRLIQEAGFKDVKVTVKGSSSCISEGTENPIVRAVLDGLEGGESLEGSVVSVHVEGHK